jgi:hypothetical protein
MVSWLVSRGLKALLGQGSRMEVNILSNMQIKLTLHYWCTDAVGHQKSISSCRNDVASECLTSDMLCYHPFPQLPLINVLHALIAVTYCRNSYIPVSAA